MQETASQSEKEIASKYLEEFVLNRVAVLRDISGYPIVKNGVMGSGISQADLSDFLKDTTILGKRENITLLNIAAEPVYSRTVNITQTYDMDSPWFNNIIEGNTNFEINLVHHENNDYFQLAVPVDLRNSVEGVLVSEIKIDLSAIFSIFFSSGERSLSLTKNGVTLSADKNETARQLHVLPHTISAFGIEMEYQIDTYNMVTQKDAFLWGIMGSITLTMGLTFLALLISGNITIIAPYKRLHEITQERNQAKIAAEESARVKGEFLASMSHEIRTPLNGVLGILGLLMRGGLKDQQKHYAKLAKSSAESLLTLINDILDFSKIEAGKLDLEMLDFNLRNHLEEFANAMGYRAQEKNIELILDTAKISHAMVLGDPGRLRQILTNLVSNAIKFTHGGEIVIRAELVATNDNDATLHCSIKDSGIGIPEDKLDKLFESFSQVDASTTRKYGGTGLGLAIVKQLCELMQGAISVTSEEGVGSKFTFKIALGLSDHKIHEIPPLNMDNQFIFIVDDNATNREVLRAQLEGWGAKVVEAMDGISALEKLEQHYKKDRDNFFAVAILDMQMPGMDGAELGRKIRRNPDFNDMKMIMMTSMGERGDARYFADLGFSAYFPKPSTASELHDALAVLIDNGKALVQATPLLNRHNLITNQRNEASQSPLSESLSSEPPSNLNTGINLLLVEDNPINQEVALGILEEICLHADTANNGVEALQVLRESTQSSPYHLILMDCQMPEMDGYQTTKEIRIGDGIPNPSIPIVAMTANAMKGDREKCITAGMDDYLTKPIDPEELTKKLEKWLKTKLTIDDKNTASFQKTEEVEPGTNTVEQKIWDKDAALKRVRGKQERLDILINMFFDSMPEKVDSLGKAIEQKQADEASAIAHSVKGSVSNLGGIALQNIAQEIELSHDNAEKMQQLWPLFIEQYEGLSKVLQENSTR